MTVKNMMIFGTFDPNQSNAWPAQSSLFPQAVAQAASQLSGVPRDCISVKQAGAVKTKGNTGTVVKALLAVISTGDPAQDRVKGALIALAIAGPLFFQTVAAILAAATNLPSAMTDVTSSLDKAIAQNPPGIVVPAPTPGQPSLSFRPIVGDFRGFFAYELLIATAELGAGAVLTQNVTLLPSSNPAGGGEFTELSLFSPRTISDRALTQMIGQWELTQNDTVAGVAYVQKGVQSPPSASVTKGGIPFGDAFDVGTFVQGPNIFSVGVFLGFGSKTHFAFIEESTNAGFVALRSVSAFEALAGGDTLSAITGVFKLTNTTGAPLAVGTHVADLFSASEMPTEM